jgi:1-acyl-sn-glycerol-3-phosphate acyltransferase
VDDRSEPTHDPFNPAFARGLVEHVLGPIADNYFRVELLGAERIPSRGPVILASNHSGNAFPHDAIYLDVELWRRDGLDPAMKFRTVYEPELSFVWWMRPFGLDNFWRRGGGVDMTFDNMERLLVRGDRVLYFPEGVPGIGKGFNRRYQLQEFKTSFLLLAARHRVPLLPLYVINGEWIHPFGYTLRPLDWLMQRVFHVPFLPLPLGLAAIVLPWIWYLGFPAKLIFVVGAPIDARAVLQAQGITQFERPERAALRRAAAEVRRAMQNELDGLVAIHGRRPYRRSELLASLRRARGTLGRILPWCWPIAFLKHERDRSRPPPRSRWHAIWRDWDLLGFYLPFGWPLLSLARRFRKPPCGYRGMDRARTRRVQGNFLWRLTESPLPPRDVPVSGPAPRDAPARPRTPTRQAPAPGAA